MKRLIKSRRFMGAFVLGAAVFFALFLTLGVARRAAKTPIPPTPVHTTIVKEPKVVPTIVIKPTVGTCTSSGSVQPGGTSPKPRPRPPKGTPTPTATPGCVVSLGTVCLGPTGTTK